MTLKEHIDDIRDALRENQFPNEAAVSQGIVGRLLTSLTWPWYNPQIVIPEYSVGGRRVDFALCHPALKPMIFIEVKQVGQSDGAERQLFEYAFHAGVPIAVLTDGQRWQFFHPSGWGNYEERRVYTLDLIETDSEESVSRLNRYLNYESVCTGKSSDAIADNYQNISKQKHIEENLPEAWNKLMEEKDEILLALVAEKVESLCGYKPTDDQVWDFLINKPPEVSDPEDPNQNADHLTADDLIPYMVKVLKKHGGRAQKTQVEHDVYEQLKNIFELSYYQGTVSHGIPRWRHNLAWAKERVKKRGLIQPPDKSGRGWWALTDKGWKFAA
ncbi:MAG: hypothetical protein F4X17_18635 [Gemmatimonadetes bacterium]|nr:hypothetical protein [Gemmatimonadota bacterium]MYI62794.1 hypothetical protein [Gemmatimonadota bacterium]